MIVRLTLAKHVGDSVPERRISMMAGLSAQASREEKVDPMWSVDEHERRIAIVQRATAAARKALGAK